MQLHSDVTLGLPDTPLRTAVRKVYMDIQTNARFASFYLPACPEIVALVQQPELALSIHDDVYIAFGSPNVAAQNATSMPFTGKLVLYVDSYLSDDERAHILRAGQQRGVVVEIRDRRYADDKAAPPKRDAFISFDWTNKDAIARPLAIALGRLLCPVWYAEFVLRAGDNMRDSIEKGLKECKKCIVILSPQFLTNRGYAKNEFDAVFTRERLEGSRVFLPVWYRVTKNDVYEYCPSLANIFALQWINRKRVDEIAGSLKARIVTNE